MVHLYTIICDDVRPEVGNKLSLMGVYYEEIAFSSIPARVPKLSIFQRWRDVPPLKRVSIELSGSCLDGSIRAVGEPTEKERKTASAQILLSFFGISVVREGDLEFVTYFNDDPEPRHRHELKVRRQEEGKAGATRVRVKLDSR
jgi:hypothetical protein